MPDLFTEELSHYLPYFLDFETLVEFFSDMLGKLLLSSFFEIVIVYFLQQLQSDFINCTQNSHSHTLNSENKYIKGCIDILNHVANVWLMLGDEFEHFTILCFKRPISQFLDIPFLDFINS